MSTKSYCDACGEEITDGKGLRVPVKLRGGKTTYILIDTNRSDDTDLCKGCIVKSVVDEAERVGVKVKVDR